MFKKSWAIIIGLLFLFGVILGGRGMFTAEAAGEWTFVDGGQTTGINYNPSNNAANPFMAIYKNELYAAWEEPNTKGGNTLIRVKKYNGTTWIPMDDNVGLNISQYYNASHPSMIEFNGCLYVTWDEKQSYYINGEYIEFTAIRLKRYNGVTWKEVDGDPDDGGLNAEFSSAQNPTLAVFNGELYVAFEQDGDIRVEKSANGTIWSFIDHDTDSILNISTGRATYPSFTVCNNQLYISFAEFPPYVIGQQLYVCRYDGNNTWTPVDGGQDRGLNFSSNHYTEKSSLMAIGNTLYVAWEENTIGESKIHLKRYNADGTWSFVDNGFLNRETQLLAYSPKTAVWGNNAYITWDEQDQNTIDYLDPVLQIRVKKYDGTNCSFIDGGEPVSQLNKSSIRPAENPFPIVYNGDLYVAWQETNGTATQIRVKKYALPAVVTSVSVPADGTYRKGDTLDFTVNFNRPVSVSGGNLAVPVTLDTGGTVNAYFVSGSGTTALTFRCTIADGMDDPTGITIGPAFNLNGCTIKDNSGMDADPKLNNLPDTSQIIVDTLKPVVSSLNPANNAENISPSSNLVVNFNETIAKGTGTVMIKKTSDDSVVETISVSGLNVTVSGSSVTIDPTATLRDKTGYYVIISGTAFHDTVGNYFAGMTNKNTWKFTTSDVTAPSGYRVAIDQDYINNSNKEALSFTFAGAEVGATYNYTLSSSGGGTPVTGNGTVESATQKVTAVNTSGLNDGFLTLSVILTDAAGNAGVEATDAEAAILDTKIPEGYTVQFNQPYIYSGNKEAFSFTIDHGDLGSTYTYAITSSGGGTAVTDSGVFDGFISWTFTGIDVSGLKDGTLTLRFKVTDRAGNTGNEVTDTITKNTVSPSGYSISFGQSAINSGNQSNLSFAFSGAEVGTTYNYTLSSSGGGSPVTGNGTVENAAQAVSGIDASGLKDGTLTLSVTLTNLIGNTGAAVTRTIKKDTVVPTVTLSDSDADNLVKAGTKVTLTASFSKVMFNSPKITIANGGVAGAVMTDSGDHKIWRYVWTVPAGDITATVSVTGADTVGNAYSGSDTLTFTIDNTAPTITGAVYEDNTHLTVTLSENCKNLVKTNNGGFTVRETGGTIAYAVTATQKVDDRHVKLTVANMGASGSKGVTVRYAVGTNGTIQDSTGNPLATNSTGLAVAAWDTTAPMLAGAVLTDNTHLTVALSENCINLTKTNNGGFTVSETGSSTNYAVTAIAKGADSAHVILTVANMGISAKEGVTVRYTAGGNGVVQDVAGNAMVSDNTGISVVAWDTASPTLNSSALASSNSYIDITFSEGVYGADSGTTGLNVADFLLTFAANSGTATNVTISSVRKNNGTTASAAAALTGGETTVRAFLNVTGVPNGAETIEIKPVDDSSIYDKAGNVVPASATIGAKPLMDKVRPTLASADRTDNTQITVTLSENCKNLAKANNGGFTVFETGNPKRVYAVTKTAQGTDGSHVVLTVANIGASGKKGVMVKYTAGTNGTIKDMANNAIATNTTGLSVAAWDTTAPALVGAERTDNTHIKVTLSENCINLTKTNNGGFTVTENGTGTNYPVTAIAKGADAAHVILTVANMGISAKEGVTVKYATGTNGTVQDVAGNAMVTDDAGVSVAAWDAAGPAILNSTIAAGNNYIDITFNEGVYGADNGTTELNAADFLLTFTANGGTATNVTISSVKRTNSTTESAAAALIGGETAVRVFLSITGTPSGAETIEIKPANDASIYDKAGNAALASVTTEAKQLKDKLRPTLVDAVRTDNTHITVTLSEDCKNIAKANNGGFSVRETGGTKTYAVTKIAKGADTSHIILTLANISGSGVKGVTVKYTAGTNGTIQDTAGNSMASNSTGINIAPWG